MDWSLYLATQVSPEQAQNLVLQQIRPNGQLFDDAHDSEMHCWSFGEHVLIKVAFADAAAQRARKFYLWDNDESWCLVLAKVASSEPFTFPTLEIGGAARDYAIGLPRSRTHQVEMLTLIAPASKGASPIFDVGTLPIDGDLASLAMAAFIDALPSLLPNSSREAARRMSLMTRSLIASYFTPLFPLCDPAESISKPLLFDRARRVVRQHISSSEFGPEQLCRLLAVSRSKLYRIFESSGGVVNFINSERLNIAHERLCYPLGISTINKIGNDLGFCDHSTFSRAFKRKFGYSPSEARGKSFASVESTASVADELM